MAGRKTRIMIVNDYPEFLAMMADFLADEGYEVLTAPKHQEAFAQVKELQPDLLICDLIFDGLPAGWSLIDMMVLDPATTEIPILLCSAATRQVQETAGSLDARGILWLEKPFTLDQLIEKVTVALQRRPRAKPAGPTSS